LRALRPASHTLIEPIVLIEILSPSSEAENPSESLDLYDNPGGAQDFTGALDSHSHRVDPM